MPRKSERKKAISVLVLLLLKLQGVSTAKRRRVTFKIYDILVEEGVVTRDEISKEESDFKSFVDDVSNYIDTHNMEEEAAMRQAYIKYPKFQLFNKN